MPLYTRLPISFYKGPVPMSEAIHNVAVLLGDSKEKADNLFQLLPGELQLAPAFFLLLTKKWCYEFGDVIDRMPLDYWLIGSEQFPELENLYRGLCAADKYLTHSQFLDFMQRLSHSGKHLSTLAELAPLVRVSEGVAVDYEVSGYGDGNHPIDWLFSPKSGIPILMDVKYRIVDLVQHMSQMMPYLDAGQEQIFAPELDPAFLFKDTTEKFVARSQNDFLQGAWIYSHIKQDKSKLLAYFNSLDRKRLHYAILSQWNGDAFILCRDDINRDYLYSFFNLNHTEKYVY